MGSPVPEPDSGWKPPQGINKNHVSNQVRLYHYITMAIYVCYLQWVLHTPLLSRCKHTAIKYISLVRKQHQECVRLGLQFHIYGSLAGKPTRALNP